MKIKRPWYWSLQAFWALYRFKVRLRFLLTGDCGLACGYAEPYGFVPEDGCPVHDNYPFPDEGEQR